MTIYLGAKGVVELELISSGERWGRGPRRDLHSSNKAMVDSPAWHLVEVLATLVSPDGNTPAIDGYADKVRPLSGAEKAMVAEAARRLDEGVAKKQMGVELIESKNPNIQGMDGATRSFVEYLYELARMS